MQQHSGSGEGVGQDGRAVNGGQKREDDHECMWCICGTSMVILVIMLMYISDSCQLVKKKYK